MSRAFLLLATLLLVACGTSTSLPAPKILSVSPNLVAVNEQDRTLTISLDAVIPVHVDYSQEEASPVTVRVWLGPVEAPLERLDADGTLSVTVPEELAPGTYDVRVTLSDGREAVRTGAFTIVTPRDGREFPDGDAGDVPEETFDGGILVGDVGVTGFRFEPIGPRLSGQAFSVSIRALGPEADLFQGTVTVSLSKKGSVSPTTLGPFTAGAFEGEVLVSGKGGNYKLTVSDGRAQGTSNGFKVQ